jgi:hypothetical protein
METLDNTDWDVLIVGTGLQQSLLALYVHHFCRVSGCDLTDAACEEPCRARIRKSSTLTRMTITVVPKPPLAYKKLKSGLGE